jgi:hypothetical protein
MPSLIYPCLQPDLLVLFWQIVSAVWTILFWRRKENRNMPLFEALAICS